MCLGEDESFTATMLTHEAPKTIDLSSKPKFGVTYKIEQSGHSKKKYSFIKFNVHPHANKVTLTVDEMSGYVEAVQVVDGVKEMVKWKENIYDEKNIGNALGQLGDYIVRIGNSLQMKKKSID